MEIRKRIVTIGGGTGSFTLLTGLKKYPVDISAIVSMADDGGSTGVLRDELGVLPPGDVRQCLVALSESSETLRELMNYRFEEGGLKGHSFGNLFLSALEKVEGSFSRGVEEAARILNIKGEVIPVTEGNMRLCIELESGELLIGESNLDHNEKIRNIGIKRIYLKSKVRACDKAIRRIREADCIIIGPGDHFGSIVPNLLVTGIPEAISKSRAKLIYNCNLTNKKGQTDGFDLDRYVSEISALIGKKVDLATYNSRKLHGDLVKKYEKSEGKRAIVGLEDGKARKFRVVKAELLSGKAVRSAKGDPIASVRSFIRHDSDKLAKVIMMLLEMGDREKLIKEII